MNIYHWSRKREQCNAEQADGCRGGEPSECLKPAGILELSDKLGGAASKDDRYGEDSRRSRHCAGHGGDVIANEGREYQNRAGRCIRQAHSGSKLSRGEPSSIRYGQTLDERQGCLPPPKASAPMMRNRATNSSIALYPVDQDADSSRRREQPDNGDLQSRQCPAHPRRIGQR